MSSKLGGIFQVFTLQSLLENDTDFMYVFPRTGLLFPLTRECETPNPQLIHPDCILVWFSFFEYLLTSWRSLAGSLCLVATNLLCVLWVDELCYSPHSASKTKIYLFLPALSTS